jgi:hypothetical protein
MAGDNVYNPGVYTFALEAQNSAGAAIEPETVVEEPGINQPSFISAATATATAGTPFSFQSRGRSR